MWALFFLFLKITDVVKRLLPGEYRVYILGADFFPPVVRCLKASGDIKNSFFAESQNFSSVMLFFTGKNVDHTII